MRLHEDVARDGARREGGWPRRFAILLILVGIVLLVWPWVEHL
jgi:hypothetical protein